MKNPRKINTVCHAHNKDCFIQTLRSYYKGYHLILSQFVFISSIIGTITIITTNYFRFNCSRRVQYGLFCALDLDHNVVLLDKKVTFDFRGGRT